MEVVNDAARVYTPRSVAPQGFISHSQMRSVGDKPLHEGRDPRAGLGVLLAPSRVPSRTGWQIGRRAEGVRGN